MAAAAPVQLSVKDKTQPYPLQHAAQVPQRAQEDPRPVADSTQGLSTVNRPTLDEAPDKSQWTRWLNRD